MLVLAAVLPVLFRRRAAAMLQLTWRARWLFLLLGVGYAYGLPGPAAWPFLGDYSPSLAGLHTAAAHMLRLMLLLWLLDVLVVGMGSERLMAGLHGLFSGLAWLGFPAERTTVRLGLTLQAMERNSMKLRDLTALLATPAGPAPADARYVLVGQPWRPRDTLFLAAASAGLLALWFA
ncbi:hypothetical protein EZJ19_02270 [Parasulfuritortus cantonensis]|uniref:Cobalt transporter n=1 Tax=Parasulfuritortus cantonensis TaxID=2528202 RepID=A0A4R1BMB2_9PROT|nr:hypothetical protein [Parasulfuritortus cantonensis]TCJ18559.1 hypothetical protein EZJ19_02270 [Parasulfuritortus cantonensis]